MTTHDPELVERLARALAESEDFDMDSDHWARDVYPHRARVVLDAITTSPRHALVELPEPSGYPSGEQEFHFATCESDGYVNVTGESTKTVGMQGRISNEKAPATAVTAPGCGRLNRSRRDR